MANEIGTAGLGDILLTEVMAAEILLLLADRETMRNDPALMYMGDASGSGSTAQQVSLAGFDGYDTMAAYAEGAAPINTAFTDASATITIARQALRYQMYDLVSVVDHTGELNPGRFAMSMVRSADMRLQEMIAAVTDDFTSTAGTTTVDMTVSDWYDAQFTLILASVPGPYLCMLHPRQYADFLSDLRSEGGASQFKDATQAQLDLRGPGYQGQFNNVPIFISSKVPTANGGADRAGGMWGRGGVAFKDATVAHAALSSPLAVYAGPIMVEFERDASGAYTIIVGNYYVGVVKVEDGRGVSIITDA